MTFEQSSRARQHDRDIDGGSGQRDSTSLTIQDCGRILVRRWIVVVASIVIAVVGAGALWYTTPPQYTAELTMYVAARTGDSTDAAYQGTLLSQQRVTSYVELVGSTQVSRAVIDDLGLDVSPSTLSDSIQASSVPDSVIINAEVTQGSPQEALTVAQSLGRVFPRVVDGLEELPGQTGPPPVAVQLVPPVELPDTPSSIGLSLTLALGLLAGIAVGVGGAFVRHALDTSVKSIAELEAASQAPNLGVLAYDADVPKRPLTVQEGPHSQRAESYRQLRTNLQFIDVDRPRKVIVVTSSVPAEGKTTSLCNLAIALAAAGSRVLVVEADLRRPKAVDLLGLDRGIGLTSVLAGQAEFGRAVQRWTAGGFDVLASGPIPPNPSELLASEQMRGLMTVLRASYDFILLDSPPLLPVTDAAVLAMIADGAVLFCRYNKTTRDQVRAAAKALSVVSAPLLGTVLTMGPKLNKGGYPSYTAYSTLDELPQTANGNGAAGPVPVPDQSAPEEGDGRRPTPRPRFSAGGDA